MDNQLSPGTTGLPSSTETAGRRVTDPKVLALGSALLFAIVLVVHWPAIRGPFIWDDLLVIQQNPLVKGEFSLGSIWFQTDFPLTMAGFWLEWLAWGKNPVGYHLVNVVLHGLNAVLVWRLLHRLKVPGAWLAGALFAVHPVCVPSVAWISELKNTLSLPFYLLSFWWYITAEEAASLKEGNGGSEGTKPGRELGRCPGRAYALSLAAFALALLSKTSTVMLPVVLLGYAWSRRGRVGWSDLRRASPYFALATLFGLLTVWFQWSQVLHGRPVQSEGFLGRVAGAGWAIWFYLAKALLPIHLNLIYPRWEISRTAAWLYVPLVLLIALFAVCWRNRRGWGRHALFALGFFAVNLFPVLGLLDMYFLQISRVSDHFQYLPLIGVVSGVAGLLARFGARFAPKPGRSGEIRGAATREPKVVGALSCAFVVLLVGGLSFATTQRARLFASDEGLWRDTLAKNPSAWPAHNNLACILAERQELPQAIEHFEASLRIYPGNAAAHANLGQALALRGDYAQAETHFRTALELKPNSAEAHRFYASALLAQGRLREALPHFEASLQLQPDNSTRLDYALAFKRTGNAAAAVQQFRRVLAVKPDLVEALNNLAWTLATCSDEKVRDGKDAVRLAEQSCRLTEYKQAIPVGTLAAAYAESGRFSEAEAAAKQAIAIAAAAGDTRFAAINEQLLQLYRAGRPYHEPR